MQKRSKLFIALLLPQIVLAQFHIDNHLAKKRGYFTISGLKTPTVIQYDTLDHRVVERVSHLLAADIEKISGKKPGVVTTANISKGNLIIVGTIGKNRLIDRLIEEEKLHVDSIKNQWERFLIQTVDNPFGDVKKALVIAGSDKRGTAFGVFTLSEKMGISPWYWWADIPVKKSNGLYLKDLQFISKAPSVKYRGIFLNDEDWGLHPWAAKNIDPQLDDIGPNTYEKIFELLLRLKANMVAPAMHECTKAFYTVPGNMEMAKNYGIIITTSHCEPLLYNNATEWDKEKQGEWNYVANKEEIKKALDTRVMQAHKQDNIYTIALRGMHDEGMKGGSDEEKLKTLDEAIKDQRKILGRYIDKPLTEIPQIFVPYKEVLGLYEKGLEVPEDITIVWPDDNYGYIKKLSNKTEQKREGGTGVYYHISYLGWPNDYLWLNTTPPAFMFAEMHKAYSLGADKYWLVNVGDIKPGELGMQLFLEMAWDFEQFNFENINDYQVGFLVSVFGDEYRDDLEIILDRYYYHGFTRKPEYMTWDWRWNSLFHLENVKDTEFSFINYKEAETRLKEYDMIARKADSILKILPEDKKASFFELVYYPVKGASLYNHEMLTGQKNRWYAKQGRAMANLLADEVKMYHDSLAIITQTYNNLLNGKWKGMMTAPGFLPEEQLSPTKKTELPKISDMAIFVEGQETDSLQVLKLPEFNSNFDETYFFEIYNRGSLPINWNANASESWIKLNETKGTLKTQKRIDVSVDWDLIPKGAIEQGKISISGGNKEIVIEVSVNRTKNTYNNLFVENNGVISIPPAGYHRKTEKEGLKFTVIDKLGYCNSSLQLGNAQFDSGEGSFVEYDFYTSDTGKAIIYTYMLPHFAKDKTHGTSYGVQIDDNEIIVQSNNVKEYSEEWAANIIRNSTINKSSIVIDKAGKHTLKIYSIDPGMIIQKIVIDIGGLKKSYIGPKSTLVE
jgi:hypothetical protein